MGGLIVDVFIAYLFKTATRKFRARKSRGWPIAVANIAESRWSPGGFGCPTAQIVYLFTFEGKSFGAMNEVPFILPFGAQSYVSRFPVGSSLRVRRDPTDPNISVVCESDQS
jgi:hypothetical protein